MSIANDIDVIDEMLKGLDQGDLSRPIRIAMSEDAYAQIRRLAVTSDEDGPAMLSANFAGAPVEMVRCLLDYQRVRARAILNSEQLIVVGVPHEWTLADSTRPIGLLKNKGSNAAIDCRIQLAGLGNARRQRRAISDDGLAV